MAARLAIVTGANTGIGLEIARGLALAPGVHCILTARDVNKGQDAVNKIRSSDHRANISFHQLDVRDTSSVDALATHVRSSHNGTLSVLVNNAGFAYHGDAFGPEEARLTIDTNFYGTRRSVEALLPFLKAAAGSTPGGARIINVCSQAGHLRQVSPVLQSQFQAPSATADSIAALAWLGSLQMESFISSVADGTYAAKGWPRSMYGISKLGEIAYTYVLAKALLHDNIVVAAICPGYCATAMSSFKGHRTPAQGADTALFLALKGDLKPGDVTGGLWYDRHLIPW